MEIPDVNSWSAEANWTIAHGSLDSSITFDSSDSPIDSETTVNSTLKSPLILKPSSPDCGSCEIKISFTQSHEVRQVYIRSTARVYEIYYVPGLQSSNEYLCTVRCGIASRDGESLHAADIEESVANWNGSAGELAKEKFKHEGSVGSSEDDWVEVKVPNSPLQDNRTSSLPEKIDANRGTSVQDLYEATAEITDADPCISLMLRLLSLQSKECVYVDEIYIFADPVGSADTEQAIPVGNPAGSSLVAMLVPTLLQLSKTGISRIQDKHESVIMEKPDSLEIGSRTIGSTNIANATQQEEQSCIADQKQDPKLQDVNGATANQMKIPEQVLDREEKHGSIAKNDLPFSQIERTLEQLVSRVSRIEDICSRFEENMLKPISIMEARLQHVEQQMEVFTKNSQCSVLTCGTRFFAPAFSCNESGSSSFYNDGSDYPACGGLDLKKKDSPSANPPNQPEDVSTSVNAAQFVPSLVVTAPEFSCGDDEEDDALESQMDSPQEKPKKGLSIDDALAAALNGLISTSIVQTTECTQTLTVKAPEFTTEENGNEDELASPGVQNEKHVVPSTYLCKSNGISTSIIQTTECTQTLKVKAPEFTTEENGNEDELASPSVQNEKHVVPSTYLCKSNGTEPTIESGSTSSDASSVEGICHVTRNLSDEDFEETSKGLDGQNQFDEEGSSCGSPSMNVECPPIQAESTEDIAEQGSCKDLLHNAFKSSCASSTLDFETPILDVKFASWGISTTKTLLEALLSDVPEYDVQTPHVQESDDGSAEQKNIISGEDRESIAPLIVNHPLVDLDSHEVRDVPATMEGEELQHPRACDRTCTSLI
ncbi:uncharacterized protein LOC132299340 [Cornus florida]|uniref:uncharacterized protein LOC132299340 n=1 Tax=Cornus florida TaxID=4283 RepID=UPI00289A5663|nr:uncharacterized protein LOC132299340 [Cornus florida]